MTQKKFSLIAAACENMGIGIKGSLPWCLKNELKYFNQQTTKVVDNQKKNALIMGRKTYFGIPANKRPLPGRLNIVLSTTANPSDFPEDVLLCKSFAEAVTKLSEPSLTDEIENIWIVGGYSVYKEVILSPLCHRIYFTDVKASFECDAFFPTIPSEFRIVPNDDDLPSDVQEENGIKYQYKIYEKCSGSSNKHFVAKTNHLF